MARRSPTPISPGVFWIASGVFFLSGGTSLAYQILWFKRFTHVWGSSSLAFAAVGASFLFGLGLGAYVFGRLADRLRSPLRTYGYCELAIGGLALVIPYQIATLVDAAVGLHASLPTQPLLRYGFEFGITLAVLGPPCFLMGGTLPLLIRQLTPKDGSIDEATAWLYAINTFGAALGCYLAGFHLLPFVGLLGANYLVAAVNLAIGVASILASRGADPKADAARPPAADVSRAPRGVAVAALLAGCGALVLEMTWSRQLALVLGGSTYAYTATLIVVLLGIGAGSMIFHSRLRPVASSEALPIAVVGALIASAWAGSALLPRLSLFVGQPDVRELRGDAIWNAAIAVGVSSVVELVPAVCMGILFPLFVHLTRATAVHVGNAVGRVYAWNTLGSIAGASGTAILLFPTVGTSGAVAIAAALYVLALLAMRPWRSAPERRLGFALAAVGAALVLGMARPPDPRLTNLGFYLYGDPGEDYGGLTAGAPWTSAIRPLFFREGASSNVLVHDVPGRARSLRLNGKVDASSGPDMHMQLGSAYLARFLVPDAKEVLVIGYGSGCTPGASLQFPGTHVTACEIEPAVYEASEHFAALNHAPHRRTDGSFSMVFGDGRTAIRGSAEKFDLIISEPSNPWLAGVSNLFTKEHFRAAREQLRPGGLLAQWMQTYNLSVADYAMILRTLRSEFPHVGILAFSGGADTILLASERPLLPDAAALDRMQETVDSVPSIRGDLLRYFGTSDVRLLLLEHFVLGEEEVASLVEKDPDGRINTDLNLLLEFDAPLHLFRRMAPEEDATVAFLAARKPGWTAELAARLGLGPDSAEERVARGQHALDLASRADAGGAARRETWLAEAAAHFEAAIRARPDLAVAHGGLARARIAQDRRADAAEHLARVAALDPEDALSRATLAEELLRLGRPAEAVTQFRAALALRPDLTAGDASVMWANNLAWILATSPDPALRNGEESVLWATRASAALGDENVPVLDTLSAAFAEAGRFDDAIGIVNRMESLAAGDPAMARELRARLAAFRDSRPVRAD